VSFSLGGVSFSLGHGFVRFRWHFAARSLRCGMILTPRRSILGGLI
tara:strand:+ start:680 stop:817 length:138 start_codon:yes stop_codon:yes gene_type:complete